MKESNNELDVDGFFRSLSIVFGSMSPKERNVLCLRHGINYSGQPLTLAEVGKELGVTRERVRQIEAKAEERIRSIIKDLSVYKESLSKLGDKNLI